MEQPKREPTPLKSSHDGQLCLKCGFPNRAKDARCMYCKANLREEGGFFTWIKQTYYVLLWRREFRQKKIGRKKNHSEFLPLKSLGYFVIGMVLIGVGLFLFIEAVDNSSFSNAIISVLLLLYGSFAIKALLKRD